MIHYVDIFTIALRLGLTSFGGPTAHLAYFHNEYVKQKRWLSKKSYADLVALSQFLPGPASSQVGIGIGLYRGGLLGGILAFLGFTLPSVFLLIAFAMWFPTDLAFATGLLKGLQLVAVAIVAHAIIGMSKSLASDAPRQWITFVAMATMLLFPHPFIQVGIILIAACIGRLLFTQGVSRENSTSDRVPISKRGGSIALFLFFFFLFAPPIILVWKDIPMLSFFESFYQSGALVFGGGHVVLPLLEQQFVSPTGLSGETFLAGYGATQAVPGPLFTFAAFLGAVLNGPIGGLFATFAMFLPAFLLIVGALPFWDLLRNNAHMQGAVSAMNAAVLGLLIAAFYDPIWTSSMTSSVHFTIASLLFLLLQFQKWPSWKIVLLGAMIGAFFLS